MIRPLFALTALVVLVGSASAQDLPGPKITWPDVKGLKRQKPNMFKDEALGYSVSYIGDVTVATCFVYNLGFERIPTGPNSDMLKAEMYESLLALEANKTSGRYKTISPLDEKVIPFGSNKAAPQIRRKRYEVELPKDGEAITELYVTGYKNHFIKIRSTYPTDDKAIGEKDMANLLDALGKALK
ncbi:MAG: hypothetical protein L0241_26000 [Planctomycetia bacterium]|nr:hypothetical protein [Planctomycetia bacterium]